MSKIIYSWLGIITVFVCFLFYLQCYTTHNCAVFTKQIEVVEHKIDLLQFIADHPKKDTIIINNQINVVKK